MVLFPVPIIPTHTTIVIVPKDDKLEFPMALKIHSTWVSIKHNRLYSAIKNFAHLKSCQQPKEKIICSNITVL